MDIFRRFFFTLVLALCLSAPASARADVIDSILYLIDPDLATSRPLTIAWCRATPLTPARNSVRTRRPATKLQR